MPSTVDGPVSLGWVRRVAVAGCLLQEAHNSPMEALHNNPQHPTEGQKKLTYTSQSSWRRGNNVPANQWRGALSPHSWAPFLYPAYSTVFLAENHLCIPVCKKLLRGIVPGELWLLWFWFVLVCFGIINPFSLAMFQTPHTKPTGIDIIEILTEIKRCHTFLKKCISEFCQSLTISH